MDERPITDVYFAAALLAYGLRPLRVERKNPKKQKFIFCTETIINVVVQDDNKAIVPKLLSLDEIETYFLSKRLYFPGNYPDSVREIKYAIHSVIEE